MRQKVRIYLHWVEQLELAFGAGSSDHKSVVWLIIRVLNRVKVSL